VANQRFATAKIMGDMEKTTLQVISPVKTWPTGYGNPGNTRPFIQTHDNHCVWNWEQTGTNTIVENTYLFNVHQQIHYRAQLTRHQIKVNWSDKLLNAQPIMHGHPIMMQQSTKNTWTFT
jgi:hypothetical protein